VFNSIPLSLLWTSHPFGFFCCHQCTTFDPSGAIFTFHMTNLRDCILCNHQTDWFQSQQVSDLYTFFLCVKVNLHFHPIALVSVPSNCASCCVSELARVQGQSPSPSGGLGWQRPPDAECLLYFACPKEAANLPHYWYLAKSLNHTVNERFIVLMMPMRPRVPLTLA